MAGEEIIEGATVERTGEDGREERRRKDREERKGEERT